MDLNIDWNMVLEDQAEEIKQLKFQLSVERTKTKQLLEYIKELESPKDEAVLDEI